MLFDQIFSPPHAALLLCVATCVAALLFARSHRTWRRATQPPDATAIPLATSPLRSCRHTC